MYNKSREKLLPKPPASLKPQGGIKPSSNKTQNTLPVIKSRKDIKPPSAKQFSTDKKKQEKAEITQKISSKKIEIPKRAQIYNKYQKKKEQNIKQKMGWNKLPLNLLIDISQYCCIIPLDVYKLSLVCSTWRQFMDCQNAIYFWKRFKKAETAKNFSQFKKCLQSDLVELKQKRSIEFETMFTKLFNYGSTKQNIPNKLISKLKLEIEVVINKKRYLIYPYKLRNFNFSSYLYAKINELKEIQFDMYTPHNFFKDNLEISITFYSRTFKVSHQLNYKFCPQEIADCAIRQKAFNYFIAKNLIITFFEGDKTFLYCFLQISVLELITYFRKAIKNTFQQHIDKKSKNLPMYKKLCETQFQNFIEYLKYQADFQLHMSYHNSIKQIFTHCDTKVYPLEYNEKSAYFQVKIDDTFDKTSTFLLDNKMGMAEKIDDLYLLDFVLKDRDRFLIVFSGFIYARDANQKQRQSIQNYFQFSELPIKIVQFKAQKYDFSILIIEESRKNFIKHARFHIYA